MVLTKHIYEAWALINTLRNFVLGTRACMYKLFSSVRNFFFGSPRESEFLLSAVVACMIFLFGSTILEG